MSVDRELLQRILNVNTAVTLVPRQTLTASGFVDGALTRRLQARMSPTTAGQTG